MSLGGEGGPGGGGFMMRDFVEIIEALEPATKKGGLSLMDRAAISHAISSKRQADALERIASVVDPAIAGDDFITRLRFTLEDAIAMLARSR